MCVQPGNDTWRVWLLSLLDRRVYSNDTSPATSQRGTNTAACFVAVFDFRFK